MKTTKRPQILRTSAAALLALALSSPMINGNTLTWTGAGNVWELPANWVSAPVAGLTPSTDPQTTTLIFSGAANTNSVNDGAAGTFVEFINFAPGAASFSLSGAAIIMEGGGAITNNSANRQTISFANAPLLGGSGIQLNQFNFNSGLNIPTVTWTAAAGDIRMTSDVSFATPMTIIFAGARNFTATGSFFDVAGGAGSIVKNGSGVLTLTGKSTYLGNTTVNGGTLLVDGAIASRNTYVNAGGTLGGIGIIGGHVFNSGNVAPGTSPGTLTIKGNYNQSSNGTLTIEIGAKKGDRSDRLDVGGKANLDGTLRVVQLGKGPRLTVCEKVTILTAQGGVEGEFSDVVSNTIVVPNVVYLDNSVVVEGGQGSFSAFANQQGMTYNQRAVAGGLDRVAFRNQQPKLVDYMNCQPLTDLASDFDRIAPDEMASLFNTGVALATLQGVNVQRRMADIRAGSNGFSAAGYHAAGTGPNYSGGVAGPTGNEGKDSKVMLPPENRFGAFITGVGEWVDVDGDGNARGYDINTGGLTLGLDYKFTPNFAAGLMVGYAGTSTDLDNGGQISTNGGKVGLFATYFTGGFYVDSAISGGYNSYDTERNALQGTARGDTNGSEFNLLIGTGYDWTLGALTIGPTATFQYTYIDFTDFTETGSLAPLRFQSQSTESIRTTLGFKATYDWKVGGVLIKPELRAAWQHEYGDDAYDINSSFNNGNGNLFTVRGPSIGRDSMLLGAGLAVLWNERTSTYVYYDGELFRDNYTIHSVSGGVRITF